MKARKVLISFAIVIVGLSVGFFERGFIQRPVDRAQSALNIFASYCVPFAKGQFLAPTEPMIALESLGEFKWVDPGSNMLLSYSDRGCSVSDALLPMNEEERGTLDATVVGFVDREFSWMHSDNNHGLETWAAFLLWESHPPGHDKRSGAVYSRYSADADSETTLSFGYPINSDVSEKLRELRVGS